MNFRIPSLVFLGALFAVPAPGHDLAALQSGLDSDRTEEITPIARVFDGYKNYWARDAWTWNTARGLFVQSQQSPEAAIWAMEEEIGNQFMLEELWVQPGFMEKLAAATVSGLERPSEGEFSDSPAGNLLVSVTDLDEVGRALVAKLPEKWQFRRNRAFYLESGEDTVFVLACHTPDELARLKEIVQQTLEVVQQYDFHRGLAGVVSNYLHITPGVDNDPFELVGIARSLGCDWLSVNGYNDWMYAGSVAEALKDVGDPFLFISGQSVSNGAMYGLDRYPDVQDNTVEESLDWAAEKGGHFYAGLSAEGKDYAPRIHGYLASTPADVDKSLALGKPFMVTAGDVERPAPRTMVAFLEKGTALTKDALFAAIEDQRAVGVFAEGVVAGPEKLVTAMRFLLLESTVLADRIGGRLTLGAEIEDGKLTLALQNNGLERADATLALKGSAGIALKEDSASTTITLGPGESAKLTTDLAFTPDSGGHFNLVGIAASVGSATTHAVAAKKLPPAISFHTLRYDAPGTVHYPVSVWNSSTAPRVNMAFVVREKESGEEVHRTEKTIQAAPWRETKQEIAFEIAVGDYIVEATALGATTTGQLAVREAPGEVKVFEEDMDGDGVPEIIMESDTVRVAVLMEGGRIIEYILKETGENVFFKLWPETPPLHGTIGGTRPFYPYGGLEEFIGYPYIGGHIVYHNEVLQDSGDKGRVRVWANIHGSKISKVYTLYAGGPVLEATYQFQDMTPTIHTVGINPLFELGPSTGPEDHYYFPEDTIVETRPELERYYGRACFPKEGWAAGADPEAGVSLVIGYPVNEAIYLHLWNNHPDNEPTPYYYTELQPWLQFDHESTTYFSYYVLGSTSEWTALVDNFRAAGLVTERIDPAPWRY